MTIDDSGLEPDRTEPIPVNHQSPIDQDAQRRALIRRGYDPEEIIRDANFSHGFCPDDTNNDGDCGKPTCPTCGPYRKQQDIRETPAVQRTTDTF